MSHVPAPQLLDPPRRRPRWRLLFPAAALLAVAAAIVLHITTPAPSPIVAPPPITTYYVSPGGDDSHDGMSPDRAWRSLDRAEQVGLKPGERLLLEGGARLPGSIRIGPSEAGDADAPVVVGSYGTGRATIDATGESGVTVYNTGGVEIRDLTIVGDPTAFTEMAGIKIYADVPAATKYPHVIVSQVDVSGFQHGLELGGVGGAGFRDVLVSDSALHGNRDAGLASFGPTYDPAAPTYAHEDVRVRNVAAFGNLGNPDDPEHSTGNGIVLGSVHGGVVEDSDAHDNGANCNCIRGPIGIWTYDSTHVVIQRNVSYRNTTGSLTDGGGYGLDNNASDSVLQYNLAYENDGAGFLVFAEPGKTNRNNLVRFNISHNDARKSDFYAGIHLLGELRATQVYHNTAVITPSRDLRPAALKLAGDLQGVLVANNILSAEETEVLSGEFAYSTEQVVIRGNDLYRADAPWRLQWGATEYRDIEEWRATAGQERIDGRDTGYTVAPGFDGRGTVPDGRSRAAYFALSGTSPLVRAALDLAAEFGVDPGPTDYFGGPITGAVGAVQRPPS
jgi:Right handed beta helix region